VLGPIFHIRASGSTPRRELAAGTATFLTMAYIIFLNPAVLSLAGMDFGSVMVATCLSAAFGTLLMGLLTNYPIALAPGMGENFFLVTAVLSMGITWQQGLAAVFFAAVLFFILSVIRIREMILDGIPDCLKFGIAGGIGLFIVMIGFVNGGIVIKNPVSATVPVALGDVRGPIAQTSLFGLLLTLVLAARRIRGAVLLGILGTAIFGLIRGTVHYQGIVSLPPSIRPTFLQMDLRSLLTPAVWPVVLIFLFMSLFDAIGTLIGVGEQAGLIVGGRIPKATRALCTDSAASVVGACLGTSDVTPYIESAAGVQAGGRTGFANVVTAGLFLAALFFMPLVQSIGGGIKIAEAAYLYPVTAPAMILVGAMMTRTVTKIPWEDPATSLPAFLIVIGIPLTYSIAEGMAFGFIAYPIVMTLAGRAREVRPLTYLLAALFILRYALVR
jgi:adenine/guanine/hypoxanthine permease